MSDAAKDAIALMAMDDLFGHTEEGRKAKEVYEQTGRLYSPNMNRSTKESDETIQPIIHNNANSLAEKMSKVSIDPLSMIDEGYKEKSKLLDDFERELRDEANESLKKIIKNIR